MRGWLVGTPVWTNTLLVETVQHSRSPSRARRRARLGHRQHYRTQPSGKIIHLATGELVMHPAIFTLLKAKLAASGERQGELPWLR